jgi:peroxiredoxin
MLERFSMKNSYPAPELQVQEWIGSESKITLESLRGKVIMIEAFQLLCPGCVSHAIPQAIKVRNRFKPQDLSVLGLHSVFEHHEGMKKATLEAFIHEYKVNFPVAIDEPGEGTPIPKTMSQYNMRGTPTTILIDKFGKVRSHHFGLIDDLSLGAEIALLIAEEVNNTSTLEYDEANAIANSLLSKGCRV